LMLAHAALGVPFVVITVRTALDGLGKGLEGAARTLGAGPRQVLSRITIPLIAPAVITGAVMAFLTSFDEVVVAPFLSGVNTRTLPKQLWQASTLEVSPVIMAVGLCIVGFVIVLAVFAWALRLLVERRRSY